MDANLYGCLPCPFCGAHHRASYKLAPRKETEDEGSALASTPGLGPAFLKLSPAQEALALANGLESAVDCADCGLVQLATVREID